MDKQFFVCHSSKDIELAKALVEELEASGYVCWLSSRNIPEGADTEKPVYRAILESAAVLLIFTENANESLHIKSELDIAANRKIPIIPLKFRDAEISKSIGYYTYSGKWIDCRMHQVNTPEITETIVDLARKPLDEVQPSSQGYKKWIVISSMLLVVVLSFMLFGKSNTQARSNNLVNIAVGGRDSWDYASNVICRADGGYVLTGAWDWGYWSEIWVACFDSTSSLTCTWSDSIAGECKPLSLPTADGGCITVYTSFAETHQSGFVFRAVRLTPTGVVKWEMRQGIDHPGGGMQILSSLSWLPDSTAIASFIVLSSVNNHTLYYATIPYSGSDGEIFAVPGTEETLCQATSYNGHMLQVYRSHSGGPTSFRVFDSDWHQLQNKVVDLQAAISCVEYCPDNSIIASCTSGGSNGVLSVVKFSEDLDLIWESSFDEAIQGTVTDMAIQQDGSIILVGSTSPDNEGETDGRVLRLNSSGDILRESVIDTGGDDHILTLDTGENGYLLLAGSTTCFGDRDAWFMSMTPVGEFDNSCQLGIDLFSEDWESGFLGQSSWMFNMDENNPPEILEDEITGNFVLTTNGIPVMVRESVKLVHGLCFSAEITLPGSGEGWVATGTTEQNHSTLLQEAEMADCELKLSFSPEQQLTVTCRRISPLIELTESIQLSTTKPLLFTMENYSDSAFFLIDHSLLYSIPSLNNPDSLRFYVNCSSSSEPCRVDNIRIYRRKW